jgi:hypothetical protein
MRARHASARRRARLLVRHADVVAVAEVEAALGDPSQLDRLAFHGLARHALHFPEDQERLAHADGGGVSEEQIEREHLRGVADVHRHRHPVALEEGHLAADGAFAGAVVLGATTARGTITLPVLYAVILVLAAASTFDGPARAALLPTLVPLEMFPRAVTIASTNQALAFATGPALGGLLIAAAGVSAVYVADAVLICGSLTALAFVRATRPEGPRGAPSLRAIRDGLSFVRRRPVVLGCMVLDMFAVIFGAPARRSRSTRRRSCASGLAATGCSARRSRSVRSSPPWS